jgi:hypothetical protein
MIEHHGGAVGRVAPDGSVDVGDLDQEGPERFKAAYGANYARLVEVK